MGRVVGIGDMRSVLPNRRYLAHESQKKGSKPGFERRRVRVGAFPYRGEAKCGPVTGIGS